MISTAEAIGLSIPVTLGGLAAALAISPAALVLALIIWIIGFLYNWKLKGSGLPGNLMVSTSLAATFILGAIAVSQSWNMIVWFFALGAFLVDLAEEISGDAMDMEGDRLRGSRSLALRFGRSAALRISDAIFALVLILTAVPLFLGWMGVKYFVAIIVMNFALVIFTIRLLRSSNSKEGIAAMRGIYLGILAGMLVYMHAQFFYLKPGAVDIMLGSGCPHGTRRNE